MLYQLSYLADSPPRRPPADGEISTCGRVVKRCGPPYLPPVELTPELMISAYCQGAFPMADDGSDDPDAVAFYRPHIRGVMPLDERFRVRRSLAKRVRNGGFEIRSDTSFGDVVGACAQPRLRADGREKEGGGVWINPQIQAAFLTLHELGLAHSVEVFRDDQLIGGLYGLALGGAFFGESMFSREKDASQVALVHLVDRLRAGGFILLDTQFNNDHLAKFGVEEIADSVYRERLTDALEVEAAWSQIDCLPVPEAPATHSR